LDSSKNEFIELYNPGDSPISLNKDNFQLKLVNSSNEITNKKINWNKNVISSRGYFLLVGGKLIINGKELKADANFGSQLTNVSGVIITDGQGNVLDKVSWGKKDKLPPEAAKEGRGKILDGGLKTGQSLERKSHLDTNNNFFDFSLSQSPSPVNSLGEERLYSRVSGSSGSGSSSEQGEDSSNNSGGVGKENLLTGNAGETGNNENNSPIIGGTSGPDFCVQAGDLGIPSHSPIIFNEIAWMGSAESYNNEWIEFKNVSPASISLDGWQLLDKGGQIQIIFGQEDTVPANGFYLLERTDDNSVPNVLADKIYSGSLGNNDETLRLFNANCKLIDEVSANPDWPAGDNSEKRTMERSSDLSWHSYFGNGLNEIMGTPKAENSQTENPILEGNGSGQEEEEEDNEGQGAGQGQSQELNLLITEVRAAGNEEFVELYNPSDEEISLEGLYLSYFSTGRDWNEPHLNKEFPTTTPSIAAKSYYLISFGDYPGEPDPDWDPYVSHLSDDSGSIGIFSCNPKSAATSQMALSCKIDALGWGEALVKEGTSATSSENKSLARKMAPDEHGYLQYLDTNNNSSDFEGQNPTPRGQNFSDYSDLDKDGIIDSYDATTTIRADISLEPGEYSFKDLIIDKGTIITEANPDLEGFKGVKISAENMTIKKGAVLSADKKGYNSNNGPGVGRSGQGASYGGIGGENYYGKASVYGDLAEPTELGSGAQGNATSSCGCFFRPGGAGGGAIILDIAGSLFLDGIISANGEDGLLQGSYACASTAAGSGGSIYLTAGRLEGSGTIRANGGNTSSSSGAGGGGRIALYYNFNNFVGQIEAFGGRALEENAPYYNGGPGTIYFGQKSQSLGNVKIDNNGLSGKTALIGDSFSFQNIEISKGAKVYLPISLSAANLILENNAVLEAEATSTINISETFSLNQSSVSAPALQILTIETNGLSLAGSEIYSVHRTWLSGRTGPRSRLNGLRRQLWRIGRQKL